MMHEWTFRARIFLRSLEQYVISMNRQKVIFVFFGVFAFMIIFTAFKLSVLEHQKYVELAEKQQTTEIKNGVSRGTIYSNNAPQGVFATSTDLYDLAIDPYETGSKVALKTFLRDIVFGELCVGIDEEKCRDGIMSFLKVTELETFVYEENFIRTLIDQELDKRINKLYVDSVLIKQGLTEEEKASILGLQAEGIYVVLDNLYANPTKILQKESLSKDLATIIALPQEDISNTLEVRPARYVRILSKLNLATKDTIDQRIDNEKTAAKKGSLSLEKTIYRFLILEARPTRFYPERHLASQVIGFVDNDWQGRYGVEGYFHDELRGQEWVRKTKKDIAGRPIWGVDLNETQLVNGSDIRLTIDRNVQKEISKILESGVKEFRANKGTAVVMDPKTGAIIAMASYPDFDPNDYGNVYELERVSYGKYPNPLESLRGMPLFVEDSEEGVAFQYNGQKILLRAATEDEIGNTAILKYKYKNNFWPGVYVNDSIGSLYEPGSVFKAITAAIGIDTGDIRPNDMYYDKGYAQIDNFKIKNVSQECIWFHTYAHALDWSCNVGMIDIVQKIGKSLFAKYIEDFGFGKKTNITLEGETFGRIPAPDTWSRAKLFTMSFGQGITASVLQMAAAYSVLANGGIYMEPYIVDSITNANGQIVKNAPKPVRRVIKEDTSKKIVAMLTEGATIGFAKKGGVEGYSIAGKTGTSQIASKGWYETGGAGHTITSYGGFGPSSNPKFVMIVKVDRPRTAEYSETTSSALFSRMAKYLLNYYWVPREK